MSEQQSYELIYVLSQDGALFRLMEESDSIVLPVPEGSAVSSETTSTTTEDNMIPESSESISAEVITEKADEIEEEEWVTSNEEIVWTPSKIASYNPVQKLFRCQECECVGFLSIVAEHWLGTHANLRVFQCPHCPYSSAWARCVRMHLARQHDITSGLNSEGREIMKESPVLDEVTKYLERLKAKVEKEPLSTSPQPVVSSTPSEVGTTTAMDVMEDSISNDVSTTLVDSHNQHIQIKIKEEQEYDMKDAELQASIATTSLVIKEEQLPNLINIKKESMSPKTIPIEIKLEGDYSVIQEYTVDNLAETLLNDGILKLTKDKGKEDRIESVIENVIVQATQNKLINTISISPASVISTSTVSTSSISTTTPSNSKRRTFRCKSCHYATHRQDLLTRHENTHKEDKPYHCYICLEQFSRADHVRDHFLKAHKDIIQDGLENAEVSVFVENATEMDISNGGGDSGDNSKDSNGTAKKRFLCNYCSYTTERLDLYKRHQNIHKAIKPFYCYICLKQFSRADHVKKHFIRIHKDVAYDSKRIRQENWSNSPMVTAEGHEVSAKVIQLDQVVQLDSDLPKITLKLEPITDATILDKDNISIIEAHQIQSGQLQQTEVQLTTEDIVIENTPSKINGQDKRFICNFCNWAGVDSWALKRHMNTHIKPYLCTLCDYKAARTDRLADHLSKKHGKLACSRCSFFTEIEEEILSHQKIHHSQFILS